MSCFSSPEYFFVRPLKEEHISEMKRILKVSDFEWKTKRNYKYFVAINIKKILKNTDKKSFNLNVPIGFLTDGCTYTFLDFAYDYEKEWILHDWIYSNGNMLNLTGIEADKLCFPKLSIISGLLKFIMNDKSFEISSKRGPEFILFKENNLFEFKLNIEYK